jgi:hypothetical protein
MIATALHHLHCITLSYCTTLFGFHFTAHDLKKLKLSNWSQLVKDRKAKNDRVQKTKTSVGFSVRKTRRSRGRSKRRRRRRNRIRRRRKNIYAEGKLNEIGVKIEPPTHCGASCIASGHICITALKGTELWHWFRNCTMQFMKKNQFFEVWHS